MPIIRQTQLGKQGVTDNFIKTLKNQFNNCKNVRISVLSNARKNKEDVKKYSEEIIEKLGKNYTSKVIGFTIVLKKWKRNPINL
jgi:RNA-binding protein YhbY